MTIVPQLFLNSIVAAATYSIIALGFNLIYGATKFFNLAHGTIVAIGGFAVFYLVDMLGLNVYFAIIVAVILSGLIGFLFDKIIYSKLRSRGASNMSLLIASLGTMTTVQATIAILFSSRFKFLSQDESLPKLFTVLGGVVTQTQVVIIFSAISILIFLVLLLYRTRIGKTIRAISDDEEMAQIIGINTNKIIGYTFFIGSAIAGYAGILIGYDVGIEPSMGLNLLLKGVRLNYWRGRKCLRRNFGSVTSRVRRKFGYLESVRRMEGRIITSIFNNIFTFPSEGNYE